MAVRRRRYSSIGTEDPDPGRLRHRVALQSMTATPDGSGGFSEAWATWTTVWAAVEPLEGTERIRAMQTAADATHRVTLRYLPGVSAESRVLHEGRVFEVVSPPIDPEERHVWLILLCHEES
jgi:SPP1 family predicted phage head-tail adaptor